MQSSSIYIVGQPAEVQHHVASLEKRLRLRMVGADEVVRVARPGDLAIFFSEHFDRFRFACRSLKKQQVATLYMIDGILEWRNAWENRPDEPACPYAMRPVLSHKAACVGPSQARVLESWGNVGKTEIVGIPRLDELSARERHVLPTDPIKILVMTAKTPGFTEQQTQRVKHSLRDLKAWFDRYAENSCHGRPIDVVWRLTAGLEQDLGVVNQLNELSGSELASVLNGVDAVISTPSTAMLEAMIMGLPVAALDYHNSPSYLPTSWSIRSADQIDPVISELVAPSESKMLFQRMQFSEALYRTTCATDRLEKLVTEMIRISNDQIRGKQPLQFPSQILESFGRTKCIADSSFEHQRVYPDVEEFSRHDLSELQVELSHARREIRHLQQEQTQLLAELQQAHEIFEQIHRHPVAGPVVRIRQKVLGWLASLKSQKHHKPQLVSSPLPANRPDPHSSPLSEN
jgi:hypothetical protein